MSQPRKLLPYPAAARPRDPWSAAGIEPALSDMLADPTVQALMGRDGVAPAEIRALVAKAQQPLRAAPCRQGAE